MLALLLGLLSYLLRLVRSISRRHWPPYRKLSGPKRGALRTRPKPPWVKREVIRLKALMAESGTCRAIADVFNRRFARKKNLSVGKTFVSAVIRKHRYEIDVLRKQIKRAKPKPVPRNLIWATDLTGKTTLDGTTRLILAILEHASRGALWLEALQTKTSWALILKLTETIKRYGRPRTVRTDNESIFTSGRISLRSPSARHRSPTNRSGLPLAERKRPANTVLTFRV